MLTYFLLFLLSTGLVVSSMCPADCLCQEEAIFCLHRHATTVPRVSVKTQSLYVFQNGIVSLSQDDFKGLVELELLDLSQNELTEIPDGALEILSKLKNLDLSTNQITHISKNCFSGLVQLERLYLHANNIQSIHMEAFQGLDMLLELKLQGNRLTSLPSLHFPKLLLLDLSQNNIPSLKPSELMTPHLESLKISSLGLTSLDQKLIASLKNLHELDISINQFDEVPQALKHESMKGLMKLNLATNPLGELKVDNFKKLSGLQELDLSGLNLQGFPLYFFQTFQKLTHLTAAENPFNCLCPLAWFPVWLKEKEVSLGRPEETRCHFPLVNAGKMLSSLEHKDFGCHHTTTVEFSHSIESTPGSYMAITSLEATQINTVPPPPFSSEETIAVKTISFANSPAPPEFPSSFNEELEQHFCPPNICLNGGTCNFDPLGQLTCLCPLGTIGLYCENFDEIFHPKNSFVTEGSKVVPNLPDKSDTITSRHVTSTSILLDLHHFIETQPHIRGIRLTYRNLSGPDRRPMILSVPASYPEYTLRGLRPNCTYSVCASPLGERGSSRFNSSVELGTCIEARTEAVTLTSLEPWVEKQSSMTYTLISVVAALALLLGLAVVAGMIACLRKKRQSDTSMQLELGPAEPDPMELDGMKAYLENGRDSTLPHKKSEIEICQTPELPPFHQDGSVEVPLMQGQCQSNNNLVSLKPSYF